VVQHPFQIASQILSKRKKTHFGHTVKYCTIFILGPWRDRERRKNAGHR
jgi:hypothetical protein